MIHLTTQDWPVADRVERWREAFGKRVAGTEVSVLGDAVDRFAIGMTVDRGERAATLRLRLRGVRKVRDRDWLRDGCDDVTVLLCVDGGFRYDQAGTRGTVGPGQALCFSHALPITLESPAATLAAVQLPRAAVGFLEPGTVGGRVFDAHNPRTQLLRAYFDAATRLGMTPLVERHLIELACDLLANDETRLSRSRADARSAARRTAATALIRRDAARADLSVAVVADALGISVRTLERDFAAAETRFADELVAVRLDAAAAALAAEDCRRIADIAFEAGFRDLSYFNRRFRDRFGMTPSDARATARVTPNP